MIKYIATSIFLYTLVATGAGFIWANQSFALSVLIGGITMLINIFGLAYFWSLVFSKKSIALAVLIIIFKYVILAAVLWSFTSMRWLSPIGFCVGLASLIFALIVSLVLKKSSKSE
jgi:hypothetical protein